MPDTNIVSRLKNATLMPICGESNIETLTQLVRCCYDSGLRVFEFTNRSSQALQTFALLMERRKDFENMLFGVGTITDRRSAEIFISAGAEFIVAPIVDRATQRCCSQYNTPWIPGCATPTEIFLAQRLNAPIIKIFPAGVLGPGFISNVMALKPDLHLMATGGIDPSKQSLARWLAAGVKCIGLGSKLFPDALVNQGNVNEIQFTIKQTLTHIKDILKY
ncbi:bifunctional 4-hydroxy-2-oxoglutarate aldolase/2-dehydro-3-deoxy-phosphogluconate aldolase [Chryseolinea lacunae]|uniref:Bifunctional 4-hydroxy-2-oxoglutarate aldolase/2-dehydro-3-deoxy-phosphogluconate aldolase n=1 Tax=Chryseolinea lacunae TaxID=2801331 RepID=A0ABS1L2F0_9BACT|nr:bifunctional 4-hydroxy-2-oxoglutarate aldolase/2-dehydro-3-deoxy-phosphogluconate aldolase [Chryseolinea lacunae]MBL0745760.1 bifunctional 4-hydroxy-2-oxoglutarate aldolase/2-dehydro-3-deoxy-phosphogluconate aldolase [Chryseolinea lacunae]